MNQKLLRQVSYVLNIYNDIKKIMIKVNNFSKFVEYITDSVKPVQQNSGHSIAGKKVQ